MAVARTSVGSVASGTAGITANFGAGAAAGDLGILLIETANQAASVPAGWVLLVEGGGGTPGAAGGLAIRIYRKVITAGDISSGVAVGDSGDHQQAVLLTYSGYDTTTPVVGSSQFSTTGTNVTTDGVAGVVADDIALACIATDRDSNTASTNTSPNWNLYAAISGSNSFIVNNSISAGTGGGLIVNELNPSGDAAGGAAIGFSCSITSSFWFSFVIVIKAPASGTSLTIQDATSAGTTDNATLAPKTTLTVAGATSAGLASNITLGTTLTVNSATSAGLLSNITLAPKTTLSLNNAVSASLADGITLAPKTTLVVQGATSAGAADNVVLTPRTSLILANAISTTILDNVVDVAHNVLATNSCVSAGQASNITLAPRTSLALADAVSSALATNITLTASSGGLGVQSALSAGQLDNLTLAPKTSLTLNNAVSAGLLGSLTLAPKTTLVVAGAVSAGQASNLTLGSHYVLTVASAVSSSQAGSVTLASHYLLTVQNAVSAGLATNVTLATSSNTLTVAHAVSLGALDNIIFFFHLTRPIGRRVSPPLALRVGRTLQSEKLEPLLVSDFKRGYYGFAGKSHSLTETWQSMGPGYTGTFNPGVDVVAGVGLTVTLTATFTGDRTARLTSQALASLGDVPNDGLTVVFEYTTQSNGIFAELAVTLSSNLVAENWSYNVYNGVHTLWDHQGDFTPEEPNTDGFHRVAINFGPDRLAFSIDGSPVQSFETTGPSFPIDLVWLDVASSGGTTGSCTSTIERVKYYEKQAEGSLPGLSALPTVVPTGRKGEPPIALLTGRRT